MQDLCDVTAFFDEGKSFGLCQGAKYLLSVNDIGHVEGLEPLEDRGSVEEDFAD